MLTAAIALGAYQVWESFLRYSDWGIVDGRVVKVAPMVDGLVRYIHVRVGDQVKVGQPLLTIENLALVQRCEKLADELALAQAELRSEVASLQWRAAENAERSRESSKEHYELKSRLEAARAKLRQARIDSEAALKLLENGAASLSEVQRYQIRREGLLDEVEELQSAVAESGERVGGSRDLMARDPQMLAAKQGRIDFLTGELQRARRAAQEQQVLSPVDGQVVEVRRFAGEEARRGGDAAAEDYALAILERDSLEVALYLPQSMGVKGFSVGRRLRLETDSDVGSLECRVVRVGEECVPAPPSISRHYFSGQTLIPVRLQVAASQRAAAGLRLNQVVKLPRDLLPVKLDDPQEQVPHASGGDW